MTKYIGTQLFIFTFVVIGTHFAYSDVSDSQKPEVEHLLLFVETSDCVFERNGKKHDAQDAYKHIKRKYKFFRGEITTTEEFIEYSATKSTRSGQDYLIYCDDNEPIKSSEWLLEELNNFRDQG